MGITSSGITHCDTTLAPLALYLYTTFVRTYYHHDFLYLSIMAFRSFKLFIMDALNHLHISTISWTYHVWFPLFIFSLLKYTFFLYFVCLDFLVTKWTFYITYCSKTENPFSLSGCLFYCFLWLLLFLLDNIAGRC